MSEIVKFLVELHKKHTTEDPDSHIIDFIPFNYEEGKDKKVFLGRLVRYNQCIIGDYRLAVRHHYRGYLLEPPLEVDDAKELLDKIKDHRFVKVFCYYQQSNYRLEYDLSRLKSLHQLGLFNPMDD